MAGRKKKYIVAFWDINEPSNNSTRICEGARDRDEAVEELLLNDIDVDDITIVEVARMLKITEVKQTFTYEEDDE